VEVNCVFIMRAFLVFAALVLAAFALESEEFDFQADVNLTNADADFKFRYSKAFTPDFGFAKFLLWSSGSVDVNVANSTAKSTADVMLGIGVQPTVATLPFTILAYGSGEGALGVDITSFARNLVPQVGKGTLDGNFQGGVIAMAALGMQEYTPDGKPVGDYFPFTLNIAKPVCGGDDLDGDDGNLTGSVCSWKPNLLKSLKITSTYVTSKKAGILKYADTPVSPRSYEMIIEVEDFDLSDKENHVRMDIGLLTASAAGKLEGNANVVHREGKEDLYVAVSGRAVVDGESTEVDVSIKSGATGLSGFAEAALSVALGGNIDAQIAHVDFPAGAKNFVYDPAVGAGRDVYEAGASSVALSLLVALVCVLLYLF